MAVLWFNGNIYTMETEGHRVEAVVTEKGKIIAAGKVDELKEKYHVLATTVDLEGKTMIPGFVDSHMHLIGYGESQLRLDLSKTASKDELLKIISEKAKNLTAGEWLIGEGWNENQWKNPSMITKEELDHVSHGHPILLKRICRHVSVANSLALEIANIKKNTIDPPGGVIEIINGEPSGVLKDRAQDLMTEFLPAYHLNYLKKLVKKGIESCYRLGITGVHTEDLNYYGSFQLTYKAIKEVIEKEGYTFRAHLLIHHEVVDEWKKKGYRYLGGSQLVDFGPMKIFADGSLGGRTALLSTPYKDRPDTRGVSVHSREELKELLYKARTYEMPVAVHAIGDLAFEWVLDATEQHPLASIGRDRIIHAQLLRKDLVERLKNREKLVLDIQPRFLASDFPWVFDRVDQDTIDYLYAWKSLLKAGIVCAGGSDAPIEPADPLQGIHAAVTRMNPDDPERNIYQQDERLSVYEAISLFTKGSAYASLTESRRGKIKTGFDADFTILDQDPFTISPEQLLETKAVMTVVDEKIVYQE